MDQLIVREASNPVPLSNRRKNDRCRDLNILVITGGGTGKIMDISREGLSFGCLYPHTFPDLLSIDILDGKGIHLKQIMVRKAWERNRNDPKLSGNFELETGVEFLDLTSRQEHDLNVLLSNLIFR